MSRTVTVMSVGTPATLPVRPAPVTKLLEPTHWPGATVTGETGEPEMSTPLSWKKSDEDCATVETTSNEYLKPAPALGPMSVPDEKRTL